MPYAVSAAGRRIIVQDSEADTLEMAAAKGAGMILQGVRTYDELAVAQDLRTNETKQVRVRRSDRVVS